MKIGPKFFDRLRESCNSAMHALTRKTASGYSGCLHNVVNPSNDELGIIDKLAWSDAPHLKGLLPKVWCGGALAVDIYFHVNGCAVLNLDYRQAPEKRSDVLYGPLGTTGHNIAVHDDDITKTVVTRSGRSYGSDGSMDWEKLLPVQRKLVQELVDHARARSGGALEASIRNAEQRNLVSQVFRQVESLAMHYPTVEALLLAHPFVRAYLPPLYSKLKPAKRLSKVPELPDSIDLDLIQTTLVQLKMMEVL